MYRSSAECVSTLPHSKNAPQGTVATVFIEDSKPCDVFVEHSPLPNNPYHRDLKESQEAQGLISKSRVRCLAKHAIIVADS